MNDKRVYLYDVTLRDGAQTLGVDFTFADKVAIAQQLDALGIDYIEGGWPGANPTDDTFFAAPPPFAHARLTAFGMTRRAGRSADNDPGVRALLSTKARIVTMVGKTWDFQVGIVLGVDLVENLRMIAESVTYAKGHMEEVHFDAEHFFDGYKANPDYALACLKAAHDAGARWVVLCDTNGGTLPHEVEAVVGEVSREIPGKFIGVHCHDDTGNAVANSLAAVRAGARQVQGTLNGLGERCGNANLTSILPSLILKMGFETAVSAASLTKLVHISRLLDERLNRAPNRHAAYVGEAAFTHKGGLHVAAVEKDPRCYEHIVPEQVGNHRRIVVSDQAGRSNILARFRDIGLDVDADDPNVAKLVEEVKQREYKGYAYDGAEASFELLARRMLGQVPEFFRLTSFRVTDERRWSDKNELVTLSEATIKAEVNGTIRMEVAEGNGPVNALDAALRKALTPTYPRLETLKLVDYKVRILTPEAATAAVTRVMIESTDETGERWSTVGVSPNVIDASYNALHDAITFKLLQERLRTTAEDRAEVTP
ncbi:MAG: citramalate synthase [Alphaproteobacteria bacterium]|nr:citramalate synthase [Alphaproteobacteria bacterium]